MIIMMRKLKQSGKDKRGFTLIELVAVMTIIFAISGILASIILETVSLWVDLVKREEAMMDTNIAMNRIIREIRQMTNRTNIYIAGSSRIRFERFDPTDWGGTRNVEIRQSSNSAYMADLFLFGFALNSTLLCDELESSGGLRFRYYDDSGFEIGSPLVYPSQTNIRTVSIELDKLYDRRRVYSVVVPRNLQDNVYR